MSAVCVLTPVLIGAWPIIATAITGVASALGFTMASGHEETGSSGVGTNRVETELSGSQIEGTPGIAQSMRITRDDVAIEFHRDERGRCSLCVTGQRSNAELHRIGEEVAGRVTQQFAYHKLMTELKSRNFQIVEEKVQKDESIQVRVRLRG